MHVSLKLLVGGAEHYKDDASRLHPQRRGDRVAAL
jgi:hypothetical protein